MRNPVSFYLDLLDGAASDIAEKGEAVGPYDMPLMPLLAPWVVGVPVLAFTPRASDLWIVICAITTVISILCCTAALRFFYRRVYFYRGQFGTERLPTDRRIIWIILLGVAFAIGLDLWRQL